MIEVFQQMNPLIFAITIGIIYATYLVVRHIKDNRKLEKEVQAIIAMHKKMNNSFIHPILSDKDTITRYFQVQDQSRDDKQRNIDDIENYHNDLLKQWNDEFFQMCERHHPTITREKIKKLTNFR